MNARVLLLACGLLLVVTQISGLPCTVCDGNGGEDVCSCAQQVIRPPLVLPPLPRLKKPKILEPKCSCQKEYVDVPPIKTECSCKKNKYSDSYENSPQNYKYPQNYDTQPQQYDKPYQSYNKPYQTYDRPYQTDDRPYQSYDKPYQSHDKPYQPYQPYDRPYHSYNKPAQSYERPYHSYKKPAQSNNKPYQSYNKPYQSYDQVYQPNYQSNHYYDKPKPHYVQDQHHYDEYSETIYNSPAYRKEDDDDDENDDDDDNDNDGHSIYKRSLGAYKGEGQQRALEADDGVMYYPVGGSGQVAVDATSRMLARQLEKTKGKSVKEDGLSYGPRTLPVDGEVKSMESDVNEGGLQEYDREVLELKSPGTGFSGEDEYGGDIVDTKKLITYSQIGYKPSEARPPAFLRRVPLKPQRAQPPASQDRYEDEYHHHHQHFQKFIKRIQEAHKTAKKPYFGEKKY